MCLTCNALHMCRTNTFIPNTKCVSRTCNVFHMLLHWRRYVVNTYVGLTHVKLLHMKEWFDMKYKCHIWMSAFTCVSHVGCSIYIDPSWTLMLVSHTWNCHIWMSGFTWGINELFHLYRYLVNTHSHVKGLSHTDTVYVYVPWQILHLEEGMSVTHMNERFFI